MSLESEQGILQVRSAKDIKRGLLKRAYRGNASKPGPDKQPMAARPVI